MFTAMSIAAADHRIADNGGCSCGETVAACWFHVIFFPYQQLCAERIYADIFGEVK